MTAPYMPQTRKTAMPISQSCNEIRANRAFHSATVRSAAGPMVSKNIAPNSVDRNFNPKW